MSELVTYQPPSMPSSTEITDLGTLANHLYKSGFFKDAGDGYKALAKLVFGRDLGLSATAAMTGIHIVEGKPEISANVQAQMVRTYVGPEGERYDYRVISHDAEHCEIEFSRRRDGEWSVLGRSRYTIQDANRAGLSGKHVWKRHPMNMMFARAISDGVAFHCPEVTNGIRTYHEGEIATEVEPAAGAGVVMSGFAATHPPDVEIGGAKPEPITEAVAMVSDEAVQEIVDLCKANKVTGELLRLQMIAIGVEDVPEKIDVAVLCQMSAVQGEELLTWLKGA